LTCGAVAVVTLAGGEAWAGRRGQTRVLLQFLHRTHHASHTPHPGSASPAPPSPASGVDRCSEGVRPDTDGRVRRAERPPCWPPNLHRPCRPSQVIPRGSAELRNGEQLPALDYYRHPHHHFYHAGPPHVFSRHRPRHAAPARRPRPRPGSGCPDATSGGYAAGAQLGSRLSQEDRGRIRAG